MTDDEFDIESAKALAGLPPELHGALATYAYREGHSSGREEVLNYLRGLAGDLEAPVAALVKRVRREAMAPERSSPRRRK